MKPIDSARKEPKPFRISHARLIYVGEAAERFQRVFLRPFLDRYARARVQAYILDVSPDGELYKKVAEMWLPDDVRKDLYIVQSPRDDVSAKECLMRLTLGCDPGVRPNEIILDLHPREFPQLVDTCHAIATKWFFGNGSTQPKEGDALDPFQLQVNLEELRRCIKRRNFPRRPEALFIADLELLSAFESSLSSLSRPWLSFMQLAHSPVDTEGLWPWAENPDLVFSDAETFERLSGWKCWLKTSWILATEDHDSASEAVSRIADDLKRRAHFPALVVAWSRRAPETAAAIWITRPLKRAAHVLPVTDHYQPRPEFEKKLDNLWSRSWPGVVALVGLGGSGKTSLVQKFVKRCPLTGELDGSGDIELPSSDAVFVWNFYAKPFVDTFLWSLANYLTMGEAGALNSEEYLHHIRKGISERNLRRVLLVLDGLEVIQRPCEGSFTEGEFQSSSMEQLLKEIATGQLPVLVILTSRLAPASLNSYLDKGYFLINVGELSEQAACNLLRACGVYGDDAGLAALAEHFGYHSMTIHHLGRLLGDFYHGDINAATRLPYVMKNLQETGVSEIDNINRGLIRLFARYEELLSEQELAILQRVAMFEMPLTVALFEQIFLEDDEQLAGALAGLPSDEVQARFDSLQARQLLTVLADPEGLPHYLTHPTLTDYFASALTADAEVTSQDSDEPWEMLLPHAMSEAGLPGLGTGTTSGYVRTRGLVRTRGATTGPQDYRLIYPVKAVTLDLLEEIISRTIRVGRTEEARFLFLRRLGGEKHLLSIGESARAERIRKWLQGARLT